MAFKNKILAAGLAAIIAGGAVFSANCALAQTDGSNTNPTIAQMMQMIETLKQQIQQIVVLIAQLKPQETCGNGACRFGETETTCPADCGNNHEPNCTQSGTSCCRNGICSTASADCIAGYTAKFTGCDKKNCTAQWQCVQSPATTPTTDPTCSNGKCETGGNTANCNYDCN
jgi:hypothetical protein